MRSRGVLNPALDHPHILTLRAIGTDREDYRWQHLQLKLS